MHRIDASGVQCDEHYADPLSGEAKDLFTSCSFRVRFTAFHPNCFLGAFDLVPPPTLEFWSRFTRIGTEKGCRTSLDESQKEIFWLTEVVPPLNIQANPDNDDP